VSAAEKEKPKFGPLLTVDGNGKGPKNIFGFWVEFYHRSPALLVLHFVGALIAWFAPGDVLTHWSALAEMVANIGSVFPLLPKAIEKSMFPEVTALYFSLMMVAMPLRVFEVLRLCYAERDRIVSGYSDFSWKRKIFMFIGSLLFLWVSIFLTFFHGQYFEWNFMSIGRSRFWLGMAGPLFAGGYLVICFVVSVVAILSLLCCVFIHNRR